MTDIVSGKPDRMVSVRSVFGIDSGLTVPAFSKPRVMMSGVKLGPATVVGLWPVVATPAVATPTAGPLAATTAMAASPTMVSAMTARGLRITCGASSSATRFVFRVFLAAGRLTGTADHSPGPTAHPESD